MKQWVRLFLAGFCASGVSAAVVSCSSDNGASPMQGYGGTAPGAAGVSTGGSAGTGTGGAAQCAVGTSSCSGTCVNLATDALNCGMCGKACGAAQVCSGSCMCQPGLTACANGCTNTAQDGANCGACGTACPMTAPLCSGSACVATCPAGKAQCGTGCVDPATFQTDALNCGMCGKQCAAGQACNAGVCACPVGQTACGAACVDLSTDVNHCGTCEKACAAGSACSAGMCQGGGLGGSGGGGTGGAGGTGGGTRPANCPAAASLLSDFEEGSGVLVKQGGRDGWWYVYADMTTGMQTPASSNMAIAASLLQPAEGDCNKYALHSTATGHPQYVGFGATLSPGTSASTKKAVSLEQYTGVSFRLRSGAGTQPPIWFEFLNKETQPADLSGTATGDQVDAYNTRGRLLDGIGTDWKTYNVPFSTLGPRYLPSDCAANVKCEAPAFNSKSTLGLQFSLYDQFNTSGKYDLWVDDVNLTTGDTGLPTLTQGTANHPFPRDAAMANGCTKPTGASGKYLVEAFQNWKKAFVTNDQGNLRVKSPEIDNGATVSEGIAYGMLIAVYMNDRTLFDGLWAYWQAHGGTLMTWKIPGGSGSASDADEDAAFALIQASKQWGGTYLADANKVLAQMATSDIESGNVLKPGNQFGGASVTNPSYFAPAYYRVFASVDTANASKWNGVVTTSYSFLNKIEGSNGLVPAWCSNSCANRGDGGLGYKDGDKYQYDSHRTPWRMALDVCWNNNADAKDYVSKITSFFVSQSDTKGLGALVDVYEGSGAACSGCSSAPKANSMSIIGTAAVGAMATGNAAHKAFLDRAWQFILDANYTADPTFKEGGYTYYNATVGLLTALTLSGNFNSF